MSRRFTDFKFLHAACRHVSEMLLVRRAWAGLDFRGEHSGEAFCELSDVGS
eukprot:CAMPEP_0179312552 /NCGR_PEP_ID=MMETSP0797-20121207/53328_1 /TAXON_ID=47934 /ORGANISM="Dinophysis acuminata, Strain DAEP01" /LENGTH=50 /DNA_ID=CAMNT_0021022495 /DNA_START=170 /DNA_END=319 /DNA_ORIENTATION=+